MENGKRKTNKLFTGKMMQIFHQFGAKFSWLVLAIFLWQLNIGAVWLRVRLWLKVGQFVAFGPHPPTIGLAQMTNSQFM